MKLSSIVSAIPRKRTQPVNRTLRTSGILLILLLLAMVPPTVAPVAADPVGEIPSLSWDETYGGTGRDRAEWIEQTADGNYIMAGSLGSGSTGGSDAWLLKIDAGGNQIWSEQYDISGSDDQAFCVQQTADSGYVAAGVTGTGVWDAVLIKTDSLGNKVKHKVVPESLSKSGSDVLYCVQQTPDRGFIAAGCTSNDGYLVKTDGELKVLWEKRYSVSSRPDECFSVDQTNDGGYVVVGWTELAGSGNSDMLVIKTDANGNVGAAYPGTFQKTYAVGGNDYATDVRQLDDGSYIVTGDVNRSGTGKDFYLMKLDASGGKVWGKSYGTVGYDHPVSLDVTDDGGYVMAGCTDSALKAGVTGSTGAGNLDFYLVKTDSNGNQTDTAVIGGPGYDFANCVRQTRGGGYVAAGYLTSSGSLGASNCDAYIVQYGLGTAPGRPSNLSPARGSTNASLTPTLQSSEFFGAVAGDTHAASEWQIRSNEDTAYETPAYKAVATESNLTSIDVPSGVLTQGRTYWWRVRYQDNNGAWSDWSDETSFVVGIPPILLVHGFQKDKGWTLDDYWGDMVKSLTGDDIGNSENYSWVYRDEDSDSCTFWMRRFDDGNGRVLYISNYTHGESLATDRDIREYAQSLAGEIEVIKKEEKVDQVDIVAHSMGGLVSRAYIESADLALDNPWVVTYRADVRKLIMLGTANSGTPLATTFWADFLANCDENTACQQLAPDSSFLQALNGLGTETGIKNKVEYSAVAGNYFKCWCDGDGCHVLPGPYWGCGQMWVTANALCGPDNVGLSDGVIPVNSVQLGEIGLSRWFEVPFTHFALNKYAGDLVSEILARPCFTNDAIQIPTSCEARLCSPGELRMYDSNGQVTGLVDGAIAEEIPDSAFDRDDNSVVVFPADDNYRCQVVGSTEGTYGLILTEGDGEEVTHFVAAGIPLALGAVHEYRVNWDTLAAGGDGVTVRVDVNGDGKFDKEVKADTELTADEFALAKRTGGGIPVWVWVVVGVGGVAAASIGGGLLAWRLKARGGAKGVAGQ